MRICFLCQEYPPEVRGGGIGTYTYTLARALSRSGHRVHVVARGIETVGTREEEGVIVHRIRPTVPAPLRALGPKSFAEAYWGARAAAVRVAEILDQEGLDVVQSPEHGAEGLALAGLPVAHVVRFHTPLFLVNEASGRHLSWGGRIVHLMERTSARRATLWTCASRALAERVARAFGIPLGRVRIVPNATDPDLFRPATFQEPHPPTVLHVGKLAPIKGVFVLAEAIPLVLRRIPEVRFVLVGSDHLVLGQGSMKARMGESLRRAGALEAVTFLDPVPRSDLVRLYQQADVCVLPTLWDNFPNTCLEALSCGVPVVASAAGGLPEIVTHGREGLLVPPGDPARLAEAITTLLLDSGRRAEMARAARGRVLQAYTPERVVALTHQVYAEAIEQSRSGRRRRAA